MNETLTTVRGTIVSEPRTRHAGEDAVISLRIACNNRYLDREAGEWKTSSTLYLTVHCWGRLATAVGGRLVIGDGVIVQGRLSSNEFERDGVRRNDLEMRAVAIGADMARAEVLVKRRAKLANNSDATSAEGSQHSENGGDSGGDENRTPKQWDVDNSSGARGGDETAEKAAGAEKGDLVGAAASDAPPF